MNYKIKLKTMTKSNYLKIIFAAIAIFTTASLFAQPENLYIIGGPFNANKPNWLFRDIVQLEKDSENPHVFYYRGYIGYNTFGDERGSFKVLTSDNSWDGYHPDGTSNLLIGATSVGTPAAMRLGGDDTKWEIPEDRTADGYYVLKFDTENNTFLVESFTSAACPEYPVGLFCVGGPFVIDASGWDPAESKKLERDSQNPYIFRFRGFLEHNQWGASEPGNFKIMVNARTWDEAFHPGGTEADVLLSAALHDPQPIRLQGADNKWHIGTDGTGSGYWEFSVNTHAEVMTITVDSFLPELDWFDHVYISGDAMPSGWAASEVMNKVSRGVYSWTGNVNAGQFKFLKFQGKWEGCYVADTEDEPVDFTNGNTFKYEQNYLKLDEPRDLKFVFEEALTDVTLTLDLNTYTLTAKKKAIAVSSAEDLQKIGNDADYPMNGIYYLTADIDLAGIDNWIPIGAKSLTDGNPEHFTGTLDGKGYSIKNMKITATVNVRGLFGRLNHATVKDLNLANVDINGAEVVGGVAGAMFGESLVQQVSVSGNITGSTVVGGIAGRIPQNPVNQGYNIIEDCYVTANVKATKLSTDMNVPSCAGGIAGFSVGRTTDSGVDCYGKIHIRRVYVTGAIISEQKTHNSGNAAGILSFYDNHNFVKMDEVIVLSSAIEAATPNLFFCRRGPTYDQFELFDKVYARTGITLNYLSDTDKGRGGEIPDEVISYNPAETYKTGQFYSDNLSWDFSNVWTVEEGEYPVLIDAGMRCDSTLSLLEVAGFTILPAFDAENSSYELTVPSDVSSITINAVPGFKGATVTGAGEQALEPGENGFLIRVVALDGLSSKNYILTVNVDAAVIPVTGVSLDETAAEMEIGDFLQLTATVSPEDATNQDVSWRSDDDEIATVSETGRITAIAEGTANIIVITDDGEFKDTCRVTVIPTNVGIEAPVGHQPAKVAYANGVLRLVNLKGYTADLFSVEGQTVARFRINTPDDTYSQALPAGVYFLSVKKNGDRKVFKLINK
jgi:hypothetical protein